MKIFPQLKLTDIGEAALDAWCGGAGDSERDALNVLLESLPKAQRLEIDAAVGAYGVAVMEQSFLAGLQVGERPLQVFIETPF